MQKQTQYNSRPNECVKVNDRDIWVSRSCAIAITIIIKYYGTLYCLMGKRGKGCPDKVGRWVLPCGYLDWDEYLVGGAMRELMEETGFDYIGFKREWEDSIVLTNFDDGQPWYVHSNKSGVGQNITHHFAAYIELPKHAMSLPRLTTEYCESDEVDELKWIPVDDLWTYDIGFNHELRVPMYIKYIKRNHTIMNRFTRLVNRAIKHIHNFFTT